MNIKIMSIIKSCSLKSDMMKKDRNVKDRCHILSQLQIYDFIPDTFPISQFPNFPISQFPNFPILHFWRNGPLYFIVIIMSSWPGQNATVYVIIISTKNRNYFAHGYTYKMMKT